MRQFGLRTKPRDRGPQVRLGGVPELLDERVAFERLLDDAALDPLAAAVNQAYLAEAGFVGGADVLIDDRFDVAGLEGVEIEDAFDRNPVVHEAV